MTTRIQQIQQDLQTARKAHETQTVIWLSTLIGEATKIGKDDGDRAPTDAEVIALVRKFINNNLATATAIAGDPARVDAAKALVDENAFIVKYLPSQLTDDELTPIIQAYMQNPAIGTNQGLIMKTLKQEHEGQYDGKTANVLVRRLSATGN